MKSNAIKFFAAGVAVIAFSGSPSLATDLPKPRVITKAPVKAPDPTWTGFYLGGNAGIGVSQTTAKTELFPGLADRAGAGFAGGGQIGFNWQFAPHWVAGIEADVGHLGINRSFVDIDSPEVVLGVKTDWYGTVRGRLGYTSSPSLFYITGGVAYVRVTNNYDEPIIGVVAARTETARGWTAGGGIETMLGGNWSAKAEYLYIDAGSQDVFNTEIFDGGSTTRFENRFHVFRYGFNYRFGGSAAPAVMPAYNWSGFYAGANAGAALSQVHLIAEGGANDIADSGFAGGVQAGYNWQAGTSWVAGIEADIGWLGIDRSFPEWPGGFVIGAKTDWYGTVRGRLGFSTGPALLYTTGGAAFVNVTNIADIGSSKKIATGWTAGGGIEAALGGNWTAKTEYLYIDAGQRSILVGASSNVFDNRFHVFRFGLNRKFGS
jgi:outer membrane immunogenic protein